jgi:hypothetical protein
MHLSNWSGDVGCGLKISRQKLFFFRTTFNKYVSVPLPTDLPSKLMPVANSSPISMLSKHQHHDVLRIAFQPSLCHSWCAEQRIITWPGRQCQKAFRCCCDFTDLPVRIRTRRIWCYGFVKMRAHIITIRPIISEQARVQTSCINNSFDLRRPM